MIIDPPKDNFNFAAAPGQTHVPATPPVSVGGAANDAFVFQHQAAAGSGSPAYSEIDGHGQETGHGNLMALANSAPSDRPWFDAAHDASFGHFGNLAEAHAGHFIIH
jgi:hypothetical protein